LILLDKNPQRQEEATAYFSLLQKAYEVLSDPQERAWYDRNRDAILGRARQKKKQAAAGSAPTLDDLMAYFNTSVYAGYNDDQKGFFAVYRKLFEALEDYEEDHLEFDDEYDPDEHTSFGVKDTPVEPTLIRFYEKWLNFTSSRPFIEVEAYDTEYADNRRVRRAMEKENERKRDALRREFSETVRSLASFVRKRDPRWKAYQFEKQAEKDRAEKARKTAVRASRTADIENFVEPDWAKKDLDDLQSAAKEFFSAPSSSSSESDDEYGTEDASGSEFNLMEDEFDEIYCDPCKKSFKNKLQWKNHEQSKKHKQALRKLGIKPQKHWHGETEDEGQGEVSHIESDNEIKVEEYSSSPAEPSFAEVVEIVEAEEISEDHFLGSEEALEDLLERIRLEESGRKKTAPSTPMGQVKKEPKKKKDKNTATNKPADDTHRCTVCKAIFPSRNQLFKHVEEKGHALAPPGSTKKKR
jgi:DnaJ family protein A protein 5